MDGTKRRAAAVGEPCTGKWPKGQGRPRGEKKRASLLIEGLLQRRGSERGLGIRGVGDRK